MLSRRKALVGLFGLGVIGVGAFVGPDLFYATLTPDSDVATLTAREAYDAAKAGDIILIDIRRPDEWAKTGSPMGGHRVDLRDADFADRLATLADGDRAAPIALICARGVRSARTANLLAEAGFTNIIDVPEGMLGSGAGEGWINKGLPLDRAS